MINISQNTQNVSFDSQNSLKISQTVSQETYHHSNSDKSSISSSEAFFVQTIKETFENSKCPHGNQATNLCSNPNCKETALLSVINKCLCSQNHKNCSIVFFDGFLDNYQLKLKDQKEAIYKIQTIFTTLIDQISLMEEEIIKSIKGSFITVQQQKFLLKLQNEDFSSMKGKEIALVFSHINQVNQMKKYHQLIDQSIQNLENLSNKTIESFKELHKELQKQKNSRNIVQQQKQQPKNILKNQNVHQTDSKIILNEEIQTLKKFFTKKPLKQMKLLYRASQNDFSMQKFYEKCSNIPHTLILVETQFNKVIGGYTPLVWKKHEGALKTRLEDPSLQSFIFSITEKQKLELTEKENATYYLSYVPGPRFGKQGCADLWISDKANEDAESYVFGNMSYKNPKYSSCTESYKKFVGGWSEYFKTKEWEVFQVSFQ